MHNLKSVAVFKILKYNPLVMEDLGLSSLVLAVSRVSISHCILLTQKLLMSARLHWKGKSDSMLSQDWSIYHRKEYLSPEFETHGEKSASSSPFIIGMA